VCAEEALGWRRTLGALTQGTSFTSSELSSGGYVSKGEGPRVCQTQSSEWFDFPGRFFFEEVRPISLRSSGLAPFNEPV